MQVSDQAVRLWQEGWFQTAAEPSGVSVLRDPKVSFTVLTAPLYVSSLTGSWRAPTLNDHAHLCCQRGGSL